MASNLAKYARTNKSLIVFSNAFNHVEAFKKFYNIRVKPKEFGYIKIDKDKINLIEESLYCDLVNGKKNELIRDSLLHSCTNHARYILTSSRFVIFPTKFSFKRVANRLFNGFVIQGAGEVLFKNENGCINITCYGEAKDLNIKARKIDEEIIKEDLEADF